MSDWGNYEAYQGVARHPGIAPTNSHIPDARLALAESLVPDIFRAKTILDIGCNVGAVAVQMGLNFEASCVTAVDIDAELIKKARSHYSFRCSRVRTSPAAPSGDLDYFPISAVLDHGHRDILPAQFRDSVQCGPPSHAAESPVRTVQFYCEDWLCSDNANTVGTFDVIVALSIVKWIHLEHGDEGLLKFFEKCTKALKHAGHLVLEIQPWRSYEKAVHKNKSPHFKETFDGLRIRPSDFTSLLSAHGMNLLRSSDALPRAITIYQKGKAM